MSGPTRATGHPDYSSSGQARFIPEIWSGKMIEKTYTATCFAEISNTDYEGEIKTKGDTVIIRTTPTIAINDYEIGMDLDYETPTSESVELNIDKAKYFGFKCNSVDRYQSDIKLMDDWSDDAGKQMGIHIDRQVLSDIYADAAAVNAGDKAGKISGAYNLGKPGAPVGIDKSNVVDFIVDTGSVLYEQDIPESNRSIVLPIWMCGLIKKSELKDASISGDGTSMMRNGRIGMIDQYTIYASNNIKHVTDGSVKAANIPFCHKKALTFATQMTEMETLPNPKDFGKLVRGLNVFGYEVIDPNAMGHAYVYKL